MTMMWSMAIVIVPFALIEWMCWEILETTELDVPNLYANSIAFDAGLVKIRPNQISFNNIGYKYCNEKRNVGHEGSTNLGALQGQSFMKWDTSTYTSSPVGSTFTKGGKNGLLNAYPLY